ncbi:MAG: acetyl-CoA carboxylase carboxyltransferase subunit beta [Bradymonadales bacterium]|nr:MAG: acetyl-CoA carboxylase carboxyltransferase subunit beta [Bradymonadales bacterium]
MSWREQLKSPGIQVKAPKAPEKGSSLWTKCVQCGAILYRLEIERNDHICLKCGAHFVMPARERLASLCDPGSFVERDPDLRTSDPLKFQDQKSYETRLKESEARSGEPEAALWGDATIESIPVSICVFHFEFMGGSMGSVVGEKVTRCFENALKKSCPAIVISSSGGARMQEGIFSLLQMAKSCAALSRLKAAGIPYVSILAHPTTGGVAASFAMLGDIQIAEPDALIGFAGPRVIEQTIRQKLPEGFQRSDFLLEHGMIDLIVDRREHRKTLTRIFRLLSHQIQC